MWIARLFHAACLVISIATSSSLVSCAGAKPTKSTPYEGGAAFEARCHALGVVRCIGFDSQDEVDRYIFPPWGETTKRGMVVTDANASGAGSLRFVVPSQSPNDGSGSFKINFADDLSMQFGEGDEFYVQWRQRFSRDFLTTFYEGGYGWKQATLGEGDRPGVFTPGCTQLELVVQNVNQAGFPQMYHSCGGKDGQYEQLGGGGEYIADEWMTFQVHVKVGIWYKNDGNYQGDSIVQLWVARQGQPSELVVDLSPRPVAFLGMTIPGLGRGYDLANNEPAARYGKLILSPYHTGKNPEQVHPVGYVWYDELIISTQRIPDPL